MLNKKQIRLVQTAVRAAGLRTAMFDGRYRLLLSQYLQPNGEPVTSCKQLNNSQLDDLLAICESLGWRMPGQPEDYYRNKANKKYEIASYGQQMAIKYIAADLGMNEQRLGGFIRRMTGEADSIAALSPSQAYTVIEAMKAMLSRKMGVEFCNVQQIKDFYKGATDGNKETP